MLSLVGCTAQAERPAPAVSGTGSAAPTLTATATPAATETPEPDVAFTPPPKPVAPDLVVSLELNDALEIVKVANTRPAAD